jgi:hypothetical protein
LNLRRLSRRFYRPLPLTTRALPRGAAYFRGVAGAFRRRGRVSYCRLRSRCASGSRWSLRSVLFSIWRMRSRVTPKAWPTSSSV